MFKKRSESFNSATIQGTKRLSADIATLYGAQFVEPLSVAPRSAFIADGSPIQVLLREQLS